jgi:hypothetical protein
MSFFHELRWFSCALTHKIENFWAEWGSPCQVQHILHKVHISDLNPCGNPTRILMPSRCRSNAVVPLCCLEVLWRKSFFLMFYRHKRWHPCFSLNEVDAFTVLGVWWLPYQSLHRNYGLECFTFGVGLPRAAVKSYLQCSSAIWKPKFNKLIGIYLACFNSSDTTTRPQESLILRDLKGSAIRFVSVALVHIDLQFQKHTH